MLSDGLQAILGILRKFDGSRIVSKDHLQKELFKVEDTRSKCKTCRSCYSFVVTMFCRSLIYVVLLTEIYFWLTIYFDTVGLAYSSEVSSERSFSKLK